MPYPDGFRGTNMDDCEEIIDTRNEDEVIESRIDAQHHFDKMMKNSSSDSIMGHMKELKKGLDSFNATRPIYP